MNSYKDIIETNINSLLERLKKVKDEREKKRILSTIRGLVNDYNNYIRYNDVLTTELRFQKFIESFLRHFFE